MANVFELDFTNVESYNNLGEGTHNVRVSSAEFTKAGTGSDQLTVHFEDGNGASKTAWLSLVPQALWKVKQFLEAIGIDASGKLRLDTRALTNKQLQIVIEKDPNDESRTIITKYNKVAQAPATIPSAPQAAPMPIAATMPQPVPTAPVPTPSAPVAPQAAPQSGAMPPWMQQAPQSGAMPPWMQQAPQGNLPF